MKTTRDKLTSLSSVGLFNYLVLLPAYPELRLALAMQETELPAWYPPRRQGLFGAPFGVVKTDIT